MSRLSTTAPWVAGIAVLAASLFGVTRLIQAEGESPPVATTQATAGAVTALGTVAADPAECPIGPPQVSPVMRVAKVFVHEGQEVRAGDPLVQFDASLITPKLKQAEAELAAAEQDVMRAGAQVLIHRLQVSGQELAIATAAQEIERGQTSLEIGRRNARAVEMNRRDITSGRLQTEAEIQTRLQENLELREAESKLARARAELEGERLKLQGLKLTPVEADLRRAQEKVAGTKGAVEEARAAIAAHTVTAHAAGVVEQVFAAAGMTYGPSTRVPLLYLVPSGNRVVRAEVEAEFVARVTDKAGRPVTVVDANNFALKYPGKVRRVGTAFFPKRTQADGFSLNTVKVVECLIDLGPTPPGVPPLLVGQPVRVTFQ